MCFRPMESRRLVAGIGCATVVVGKMPDWMVVGAKDADGAYEVAGH